MSVPSPEKREDERMAVEAAWHKWATEATGRGLSAGSLDFKAGWAAARAFYAPDRPSLGPVEVVDASTYDELQGRMQRELERLGGEVARLKAERDELQRERDEFRAIVQDLANPDFASHEWEEWVYGIGARARAALSRRVVAPEGEK